MRFCHLIEIPKYMQLANWISVTKRHIILFTYGNSQEKLRHIRLGGFNNNCLYT